MKNKVIIAAIVVLVLVVAAGVIFGSATGAGQVKEQLKLGQKLLQEGKYQEAILAFEKAIKVDPRNVEARVGLAQAYEAANRPDDAEKVLKEAIEIDAKKVEPYLVLAKLYKKGGKIPEAIKILEEGYIQTKNEEIKSLLDELKAELGKAAAKQADQETAAPTPTLAPTAVPTAAPTIIPSPEPTKAPKQLETGTGQVPAPAPAAIVTSGVTLKPSSAEHLAEMNKHSGNPVEAAIDVSINMDEVQPQTVKNGVKMTHPMWTKEPITSEHVFGRMKSLSNSDMADRMSEKMSLHSGEGTFYVAILLIDGNKKLIGYYISPQPITVKKP